MTPNFIMFGGELSLNGNDNNLNTSEVGTPEFDSEKRHLAFARLYKDVQDRPRKAHIRYDIVINDGISQFLSPCYHISIT